MGLGSNKHDTFVRCICGAQGPTVQRSNFTSADGQVDFRGLDSATRRAWNQRAGSNGLVELQAQMNDAVERMIVYKNPQIIVEIEQWVKLMAEAQATKATVAAT
jgi:hypothetical protein